MEDIIEILKFTIPSLITGAVAAYFLKQMIASENSKRKFDAFKEKKKQSLPIRLQAYERMALFLERIRITSLCSRVLPEQTNRIEYGKSLIAHINAEFEHNLVQQIYVSKECWEVINTTKTSLMNQITALSMREDINTGIDLYNLLIKDAKTMEAVCKEALDYIQEETHQLF
ncbi:DUF7935 family protein [Wenyingzhuangia sp. IMCC45574]